MTFNIFEVYTTKYYIIFSIINTFDTHQCEWGNTNIPTVWSLETNLEEISITTIDILDLKNKIIFIYFKTLNYGGRIIQLRSIFWFNPKEKISKLPRITEEMYEKLDRFIWQWWIEYTKKVIEQYGEDKFAEIMISILN